MNKGFGDEDDFLAAVIATDHLELDGLLLEISRDPPTPGVVAELVRTFEHRVRIHLAVVERVVLPPLDQVDPRAADDASRADDRLRSAVRELLTAADRHARRDAVDEVSVALGEHAEHEEATVLPTLLGGLGATTVSAIGTEFSRLADAGLSDARRR